MPLDTVRLPNGIWHYDPDQPLGKPGGFGAVFVGRGEDGEEVAVKRLHLRASDAAHRELRIAEELSERELSHVVPILDAGQDAESDTYYVVMKRADRSLQDAIDTGDIEGEIEAAAIMADIARGLQEVPDIVHRDLKPANILFHEGKWKIADFGIARFVEAATSSKTLKGALSPQYAAPEQWRGERATGATDIYALGCIGYALLTGGPPFQGPTLEDFKDQHFHQSPPPLEEISSRLQTLLLMMLRKGPVSRPSVERVFQQLASLAQDNNLRNGARKLQMVGADVAKAKADEDAESRIERTIEEQRKCATVAALEILDRLRV